jgi:hypothetical protein
VYTQKLFEIDSLSNKSVAASSRNYWLKFKDGIDICSGLLFLGEKNRKFLHVVLFLEIRVFIIFIE